MTGLQFAHLAIRSGRNHSFQYHKAEAIRNTLKLHKFSSPDFIDILLF